MALHQSRLAGPAWQAEYAGPRSRRSRDRIVERYVIGIDLGTTNCSLASADSSAAADAFSLPPVTLMSVPQLVNAGEVREEPLLPSSLCLPGALDFPEGSLALPWDLKPTYTIGVLAQKR